MIRLSGFRFCKMDSKQEPVSRRARFVKVDKDGGGCELFLLVFVGLLLAGGYGSGDKDGLELWIDDGCGGDILVVSSCNCRRNVW